MDREGGNHNTRISGARYEFFDSRGPPDSDAGLPAGALVDHFEIMRLLGRGGMGEVYLARDTKLGRKVAVKMVLAEHLGSREALSSFLYEARTTAKFSHPHIVTIHAVGEYYGSPYVALEYIEGQNLRQRTEQQSLGVTEAMRIGLAIAEALTEAHRHGILHRDLKPENVVIPRDGRLRVLDFGLAIRVPSTRSDAVPPSEPMPAMGEGAAVGAQAASHAAGTPVYMAPERWLRRKCTAATDVWSLGIMLFEL